MLIILPQMTIAEMSEGSAYMFYTFMTSLSSGARVYMDNSADKLFAILNPTVLLGYSTIHPKKRSRFGSGV